MRLWNLVLSIFSAGLLTASVIDPANAQAVGIDTRQTGLAVLNQGDAAELGLSYLDTAELAYDPGKTNQGGWTRIGNALDLVRTSIPSALWNTLGASVTGFKAGIYSNGSEVVVAFAGTDGLLAPGDWATNLANGTGLSTGQYHLAGKIAVEAAKRFPQVKFVGHSLGGGLAQYAALQTSQKAVVFNAAGSPFARFWRPEMGDRLIAFNNSGDGAAAAGRQLGTEYVLPGGITAHGTGSLRTILQQAKSERPRGKATNWARVKLFQGGAVAIVSNNVSHMGSTAGRGKVPRGYSYNSGQDGLFVSASPLAETQFFVVEGDAATHLADHGSYGSISSPNGQRIFSVNNAGVSRTVVEKQFTLPAGQRNFSFSTNADFVTTEFPEFVGSQFDDKGRITLITPAGKSFQLNTIFSESVNSSNFTPVSNLPSPLRKGDGAGAPTGGHTGFQNVGVNSLPVSPGGTVTLRLEVENVGDQLYPSSVLINNSQAR